jgi:putative ABC transport system substrate-binding protein
LAPLRRETRTIPIVFAQVSDLVGAGIVASLARPGGNITGFATTEYGVAVKWVELLRQLAPQVARLAVIYQPALPQTAGLLREIDAGALSFGLQVFAAAAHNRSDIESAITAFAREPNGGVILPPGPVIAAHRDMIIALLARYRMPAIYPYRFFVTGGGLASYGIDNHDLYRRAAHYVDRILKGERPGDLPIQLADKYELVINVKTARALGLEVPVTLLARTDEVIE